MHLSIFPADFCSRVHKARSAKKVVPLRFSIGNSVEIFISGYPVLQDLELHLCIFFALDIVSHKLRRLLIEDCSIEGHMM